MFNLDPFEDIKIPSFPNRISVSKIEIQQVKAWILRLELYHQFFTEIFQTLEKVSIDHYKQCDFLTLELLRDPLQLFVWSRECLLRILEFLQKDINFYKKQLYKMENPEKPTNG